MKITEQIKVCLLGGFRIVKDGKNIVDCIGDSRKKLMLLEYLIVNRGREVSSSELYGAVWATEDNTNPENALKTLISRLRKDLDAFALSNVVVTRLRGYMWNDAIPCLYDTQELAKECEVILASSTLCDEARQSFSCVRKLYEGDIEQNTDNQAWIVKESVFYHNLFIKAAYHYVTLLNAEERYEEICEICRAVLEIDTFESFFNLELIDSLTALGKNREATAQYAISSDLNLTTLKTRSDEDKRKYYKKLINSRHVIEQEMDEIVAELAKEKPRQGAQCCDYSVFKQIYSITERNLCRFNIPIFVALVTIEAVDGEAIDTLVLNNIMNDLSKIMQEGMRRNDTLARYSPTQYVILLPAVNAEQGKAVLERVKKTYYEKNPNSKYIVQYRLAQTER